MSATANPNCSTVEPRFSEPLFNEVLDITNDILCPGQSYRKMYGIEPRYNEPRYNEFFDITNIIRKPKRKIYLYITYELHCQHATEDNCNLSVNGLLYVIDIGTIVFRHQLTSALSCLFPFSSVNFFTFEGFL